MNQPVHALEEADELILSYLQGRLADVEHAAFEGHLPACSPCRERLAALGPPPAGLEEALAADVPALDAGARRRLEERLSALAPPAPQPWRRWTDDGGRFVPASTPWEPSGVPGVETRRLHVDAAQERVTMLVRMRAGASYPAHRHGGAETCYVVSGDLRVGTELHMHAGDFESVEEGSRHPVQTTDGGCLLLITCSPHDELE